MRRALLAVVATVAGLFFLLAFKPHDLKPAAQPPAAIEPAGQLSPSANPGSPAPSTASSSPAVSGGSRTVTGDVASTRWGPVQVRLKLVGDKISNVTILQYPDANGRDVEIANTALPVLVQETLSAQSAEIDTVSGASYTSDGYLRSLQSAIDRAGL